MEGHPPVPPLPDPELPTDLGVFARVEGLVGEEKALLDVPARERTQRQKDRLRDIAAELDRIWDTLRERAARLDEPAT